MTHALAGALYAGKVVFIAESLLDHKEYLVLGSMAVEELEPFVCREDTGCSFGSGASTSVFGLLLPLMGAGACTASVTGAAMNSSQRYAHLEHQSQTLN